MLATIGRSLKATRLEPLPSSLKRVRTRSHTLVIGMPGGRMSSTAHTADMGSNSQPTQSLPVLGEDMLSRKAMVLQEQQVGQYFPPLQARGWLLKTGEPSSTLEKRFDFGTEDKLAGWTAEMLAYMQRAKHHAQLKIMYKSVDVQTSTHRAYTPDEPKLARPALSNKDIQLAYHAEQLLEND